MCISIKSIEKKEKQKKSHVIKLKCKDTKANSKPKKSIPLRMLFLIINSFYLTSINSTSKINVASGGITPPAPREPYPKKEGITKRALSPTCNN